MNTSYEFHLMQLADSFFPSGTFGTSSGLESLVKTRRVKDTNAIIQFIRQQIHFQLVPCDCAVLLSVMIAANKNDLASAMAADNAFYSMKLVREARTATVRSGRQLLNCIVHVTHAKFARQFRGAVISGKSPGTHPACLGIAAHSLGVPRKSAVRMMLYSYSASVVGSALRLGVIQHLVAQKILTQLAADIGSIKVKAGIKQLWQLSPLMDILQMQHERDDQRMFIT